MRRVKALLLLTLILSQCLLLSGCLSPVQLNRQAIVQGIGIDYQNGKYRLTFQVFSPSGSSGGSNIGTSADNAKLISSEGASVSEAVQNGVRVQGKELFIGQNRIIIIGLEAAKHDLTETVSYLGTNAASRQNAHVVLSATTAEEVMSMRINQGILPAEALDRITENARENGLSPSIRLFELRKMLDTRHESAFLPILSIKQEAKPASAGQGEGEGEGDSGSQTLEQISPFEISETAVFSNNIFRGTLDKEQTRGMMWIRGEVENTSIQLSPAKGGSASAHVYRADSKLIPRKSTDKPEFDLTISCRATKQDSTSAEAVYPNEDTLLADMEKAAEETIRQECEAAFTGGSQKLLCDFLNFGNILWQKNPNLFYTLRDDWNNALSDAILNVEVDVQIDRTGMEYGYED